MRASAARVLAFVAMVLLLLSLAGCRGADEEEASDSTTPAGSGDDDAGDDGTGTTVVDAGPVTDPDQVVDVAPTLSSTSCWGDLPMQFSPRCGTVEVPMDWATGEGTVTLAVAVFESTADEPADDPVVYLEGGPGGHALETLTFSTGVLLEPLLERGDVVVFDQRGAGLSEPRLACDELTDVQRQLEDIPILSDDEATRRYLEALGACHQRLEANGYDLSDYNSFNNAHDLEAIRQALGYDEWNLFGVSYGTKLALETMRRHPDGIRSVVLDSVYPPQVDSVAENPQTFIDSYERVIQACQAEAACATQGDLGDRFRDLVQELQVDPARVTVTDYLSGATDEIYLTGDTLVGIITQALYSPSWFTDLPELATDLESGRMDVAQQFLSQQRTLERYVSEGMFYAFSCQEEISFSDPSQVVDPPDPFGLRDTFDLASNTGSNAFETCSVFDAGRSDIEANEAVISDIPTLLLAGSFDPVTPVSWAEAAAETLPNGHLVVAPNASHGVFGTECGMGTIVAFLADPLDEPDQSCLRDEDIQFVGPSPEEITLVEAAYTVDPWGLEVSTVRPDDWSVGSLGGDQYRQQSFLDPTQLFQLAGDATLGDSLVQFIEQQWDVTLTPAAPFTGASTAGALKPSDLTTNWSRRVGTGTGVAVEWFETEVPGDGSSRLYVILVSTPEEQLALVDQVLAPALKAISVT